jgi:hypothetical protein
MNASAGSKVYHMEKGPVHKAAAPCPYPSEEDDPIVIPTAAAPIARRAALQQRSKSSDSREASLRQSFSGWAKVRCDLETLEWSCAVFASEREDNNYDMREHHEDDGGQLVTSSGRVEGTMNSAAGVITNYNNDDAATTAHVLTR